MPDHSQALDNPPEGLRRIDFDRDRPDPTFNGHIGNLYAKRGPKGTRDEFVLGFRVHQHMCNPAGGLHGGMLAAFLDSAMGTAVFHTLGRRAVTLRLSLDYLGPGRLGDWLQAEGEVVGHDEHVAQVRGRLYGPRHEVLTGLGAFALLSRQRTVMPRG